MTVVAGIAATAAGVVTAATGIAAAGIVAAATGISTAAGAAAATGVSTAAGTAAAGASTVVVSAGTAAAVVVSAGAAAAGTAATAASGTAGGRFVRRGTGIRFLGIGVLLAGTCSGRFVVGGAGVGFRSFDVVFAAFLNHIGRLARIGAFFCCRDVVHNPSPQCRCAGGIGGQLDVVVRTDPKGCRVVRGETVEPDIVVVGCGSGLTAGLNAGQRRTGTGTLRNNGFHHIRQDVGNAFIQYL